MGEEKLLMINYKGMKGKMFLGSKGKTVRISGIVLGIEIMNNSYKSIINNQ
jgi:hypothetical protein